LTLHKGYRNKSRQRHRKSVRDRGLGSIEKRGFPHRRYHGLTGTVKGTRGRCYEVEVKLGNSKKLLIVGKEHLRANKGSANKLQKSIKK